MNLSSDQALEYLNQEAQKQGVDPNVAAGIFKSENGSLGPDGSLRVNPTVGTSTMSPKGAVGIMQVMPDTFRALIAKGFLPPTANYDTPQSQIAAGVAAIKELNSRGVTDPTHVAVGYNASPAVLDSYKRGGILPPETSMYLRKFAQATGTQMADTPTVTSTSGSSHSSNVHRVLPDGMEEGITGAMERLQTGISGMAGSLDAITNQMLGSVRQQQEAETAEGAAKAEAADVQGRIEAAPLQTREGILNFFGININNADHSDALLANQRVIQQSQAARQPLEDQISTLTGVNPLQDPAGWLLGNIQALGLKEQRNALVNRENQAVDNVRTLQGLASNQEAIQPAASAEDIMQHAHAQAVAERAMSDEKVAALGGSVGAIQSRALVEKLHILEADVQTRLSAAKLFADKFTTGDAVTQRNLANAEQQTMVDKINIMTAQLGMKPYTIADMKFMKADLKDKLVDIGNSQTWGPTLGDSIATQHRLIGDAGFNQIQQQSPVYGKFLQNAVQGGMGEIDNIEKQVSTGGAKYPADYAKSKSDEDRLAWGIDAWAKKMKDELKGGFQGDAPGTGDFTRLSRDNPAKLDYGAVAADGSLTNNATANFVKADGIGGTSKRNLPIDDKLILTNALASVQADPTRLAGAAKDVADFYRTGAMNKQLSNGWSQLGWKPPTRYPVKVGLTTWSKPQVDLFNPTDIEHWLLQQYTNGKMISDTLGGPEGDNIFNRAALAGG